MKEIVEENIRKQTARIMEVMKFSSKTQEDAIRRHIFANLIRSMKKSQRAGHAVFDAKESRLFRFVNALRQSKNQEEFFRYLREAFPDKNKYFLTNMILQYQKQLLNTIQFSFPLDLKVQTKESKEEKKSIDELQDIAIRALVNITTSLSAQVEELKKKIAFLEEDNRTMANCLDKHRHSSAGNAIVEVGISDIIKKGRKE